MTLLRLVRNGLLFLLLAAVVFAGVTFVMAQRQVTQAEANFPPIGQFVEVDGRQVHYLQMGSGPHVVLLHGAGGNLREFTLGHMETLAERYTVTAFDRPGLGYSDRVPGVATGAFAVEGDPPMDQAAVLRAAAGQLGIENPIVVGHSFGGIVAMAWAIAGLDEDSPVNAAAVVSWAGVLMPWPGELGRYYTGLGSPLGGIIIPVLSAFASNERIVSGIPAIFAPDPMPKDYIAKIGAPLTVRTANFRANVRQVNTLRPHVVEMSARYPDLTVPIEVIHGTADKTVPIQVHPQELIKIAPSANLTPLAGIGHMPHHADPEAAIAAIDRAAERASLP